MNCRPSQALRIAFVTLMAWCVNGSAGAELRRALAPQEVGDRLIAAMQRIDGRAPRAIPRAIPVKLAASRPVREGIDLRVSVRPRTEGAPRAEFVRRPKPSTLGNRLVASCRSMAKEGYPYVFGGESPSEGGFDCSGVVHYLLGELGLRNVPRVAYDQYRWLESEGALRQVRKNDDPLQLRGQLRPGDLVFWTGTYQTGKVPNISHVMVYLGRDPLTGEHEMFGARSSKLQGKHGHGVDVYPFVYPKFGGRGTLVAIGRLPRG